MHYARKKIECNFCFIVDWDRNIWMKKDAICSSHLGHWENRNQWFSTANALKNIVGWIKRGKSRESGENRHFPYT